MKLRALEPEDLELLFTIENDEDIWDISNSDVPYSKYMLKKYIAEGNSIHSCGDLRLIIEITEDSQKKAIGTIDLTNYSPLSAKAELGIVLLKKYRNRGFGRQALQLIEKFSISRLRIHSLYAHISPRNTASYKLFSQNGYKLIAKLPDWHYSHGKYEEVHLFMKIFEKK